MAQPPYDCLLFPGGPFWCPSPFDFKFYQGADLLDNVEDGFYDDFDPVDSYEVF